MKGRGVEYLKYNLDKLKEQSFNDFDVIISDHSANDDIKNLCSEYKKYLDIHYYKNKDRQGNSSANLNNAIKNATGKLIKVIFQDDFLYEKSSLEEIVRAFDLEKDEWLISASEHSTDGITFTKPFRPKYNNKIHLGENTISSPSVLTIKNNCPIFFDENLIWLMDVDYYKRLHARYGKPKILNRITVVNRIGEHQLSSQIPEQTKQTEIIYVKEKFKKYRGEQITLNNVTLVAVSSIKIKETIEAIKYSTEAIKYSEVLLISDTKPSNLPKYITHKYCEPIKNIDEYSRFMIYNLADYIKTDFVLVIQYDGYVLRPFKWDKHFLQYDYIGAPWEKDAHFTKEGVNIRVGNGGFSLRSKKLLQIFNRLNLPLTDNQTGFFNEDGIICNYYRKILEENNIKYADIDTASKFSCEVICSDSSPTPFGFHKNQKLLPLMRQVKLFTRKQLRKIGL